MLLLTAPGRNLSKKLSICIDSHGLRKTIRITTCSHLEPGFIPQLDVKKPVVAMDHPEKAHLRLVQSTSPSREIRFEEVFLHHFDAMYRTSLRLTRNKADAEDILQEALLKAYTHFYQLKDSSKARPWLFQILVNTFRNAISKRKHEPPIIDVDISEDLISSSLQTPSYDPLDIFDRLMEDEVHDALNELHPEFTVVILLFDVEGLSYDEIAEVCQCSKGTVASRLYRGRELLRVKLEAYARKHGYV